jgi:ABC-type proline/glycine betaine transport system ATPase subunit
MKNGCLAQTKNPNNCAELPAHSFFEPFWAFPRLFAPFPDTKKPQFTTRIKNRTQNTTQQKPEGPAQNSHTILTKILAKHSELAGFLMENMKYSMPAL